jgi:hypothetical protein
MTRSDKLDIQLRLCAVCGEEIEQPCTGRRRRTCGDRCRQELSRKARASRSSSPPSSRIAPAPRTRVTKRLKVPKNNRAFVTSVVAAVQRAPGVTIPELAGEFGVPHSRLYLALAMALCEELVERRGCGWFPT